jgi:hypothetical protein
MLRFLPVFLAGLLSVQAQDADYGVDCSFPIHSKEWRCGDTLGNRNPMYEDFMEGCRKKYGRKGAARCDQTENDRIEMNVRQPQSMVNYTSTGFMKIRAPKEVQELLKNHWEMNKDSKYNLTNIESYRLRSSFVSLTLVCFSFLPFLVRRQGRKLGCRQHLCESLGVAHVHGERGRQQATRRWISAQTKDLGRGQVNH